MKKSKISLVKSVMAFALAVALVVGMVPFICAVTVVKADGNVTMTAPIYINNDNRAQYDGKTITGTFSPNKTNSCFDNPPLNTGYWQGAIIINGGTTNLTISGLTIDIGGNHDSTRGISGIYLTGGATLNLTLQGTNIIKAAGDGAGICVPDGCTLNISGTGSLTVNGGCNSNDTAAFGGAGIGAEGASNSGLGTININSGTINASGGSTGMVTSIGASAIGGSFNSTQGSITINGGNVTATAYYGNAGIGGAYSHSVDSISITGGTVTATGGKVSSSGVEGAAIGCGGSGNTEDSLSCGAISITGGTVTANGNIGYGKNLSGTAGNSGGSVAIGADADVTCTGTVAGENTEWKVGVSFDANGGSGTMSSAEIARGDYELPECGFTAPEGKIFYRWAIGETQYEAGETVSVLNRTQIRAEWIEYVTVSFAVGDGGSGTMTSVKAGKGVAYKLPACSFTPNDDKMFLNWRLGNNTDKRPGEIVTLTEDTTVTAIWGNKASDWSSDIYIGGNITYSNRINVKGTVVLEIAEGATLTVPKGMHVTGDNSLTIKGKGKLIINAVENSNAGIGGDKEQAGGTVIIDSGTVEVNGGNYAAGIGGGESGAGGNITVNGGKITVRGGNTQGAGLGGGYQRGGGNITVNGGTIEASGGYNAAGIGGGQNGESGVITVNGGNIQAVGGDKAAGIGSGYGGNTFDITIKDGTINATGGGDAAGIGGGYSSRNGTITIQGGKITAIGGGKYNSGNRCHGIGSDSDRDCTVSIGWTKATDSIDANSYGGTITFNNNKQFVFSDTGEEVTASNIAGKIVPAVTVTIDTLTNGTVRADKTIHAVGSTATLTVEPANGCALGTLTVAKTGDSSSTVDISGTGDTRTFIVPDYDVTVSATFIPPAVSYLDASGMERSNNSYTILTGAETEIGNGSFEKWYVVNSDISFNHKLTLKGDANIILVDGKSMSFGSESDRITDSCIDSLTTTSTPAGPLYDLNIYGQSGGTGALKMYSNSSSGAVCVDDYYQYGGKVTIDNTGGNGIGKTRGRVELNRCSLSVTSGSVYAINANEGVLINNAEVTAQATGSNSCAINCELGRITITDSKVTAIGSGCGIWTDNTNTTAYTKISISDADDFVNASSYSVGTCQVYVSAGNYLTDGNNNLYGGPVLTCLTDDQIDAISNKKLVPAYGVGISDSIEHGTVTASPKVFRKDTFSNLADAGKTVALTITPEASYTLSALTVTKASGGTVDVSGTGNTRTFTMPDENVTVSASFAQPAVKYLDASGAVQSCPSYTVLTGGEATTLEEGWYTVQKNTTVNYTGKLTLNGNVNLILEDGAKLYVGTESDPISGKGIGSNTNTHNNYGYNLTIYGQSTAKTTAGTLYVYNNSDSDTDYGAIALGQNSIFTLNGGNVVVNRSGSKGNGIYSFNFTMNGGDLQVNSENADGIYMYNDIIINGGSVSATGYKYGHALCAANGSITINDGSVSATVTDPDSETPYPAIYTANGKNSDTNTTNSIAINGGNVTANTGIEATGEGSIILGFSNADDSIMAAGYKAGGGVKVVDGLCFCTAGNDTKAYSGTLTSDQLTAIANKKLYPAYGVFIGTVSNGMVSASPEAFAITDFDSANKTVTLTVTPYAGYAIDSVSYNDGSNHTIMPSNETYTFTMPAQNVTAAATFKKTLNHSDISIETIADQTYTGNAITPAVTVKDGETTLEQETDYTVSYSNNVNAASKDATVAPTVTITGKGTYLGSVSKTFTINKKTITPVVSIKGWTYGDTPNSPSLTAESNPGGGAVRYQYRLNANGAGDFSDVVPTNANHVGYTVRATIAETANYYGGEATATFKIAQKPVTVSGLSVSDKTYDGTTDATVTGTAVINGLVGNDDVTVAGGTATFTDKNAGTDKTVTFSGFYLSGESLNDYELSAQPASVTADITPKTVTITGLTVTDKTYDGTTAATVDCSGATFTGKADGDSLSVSGVTGTFSDKDVAEAKTVTLNFGNAVLGGTDAGNYTIAESGNQSEATAAITKKTVSAVSEISRTYLYTTGGRGSINIATLLPADCGTNAYTVTKSGGVTYSVDPAVADGILTYTVDPGTNNTTGTIVVKAETLNYTDITITVNVKLADQKPVELKDGTSVVLNKSTLTYGEALSALTFKTDTAVFVEQGNTSNAIAGSLSWKTSTAVPAVGTTSATWVFTPEDAAYAPLEDTIAITVNKAIPRITNAPTASAITYGQTLNDSRLENGTAKSGDTDVAGTFAWNDTTIAPAVSDSNNKEYTVVFTPTDSDNISGATCKVKLIVNKADIITDKITAPTAKSLTYNCSAQELVSAGSVADNDGTVQYAVGTDATAAPAESAYTESVPKAKNVGTYYVWYRVKGNANHNNVAACSTPISVGIARAESKNLTINKSITPGTTNMSVDISSSIPADVGSVTGYALGSVSHTGDVDVSGCAISTSGVITATLSNGKSGNTITVPVTLTVQNYTTCTAEVKITLVTPHTHYYTATVTKEATCTEDGERTYRCTCGSTYTEVIKAEGHKLTHFEAVDATTEKEGNIEYWLCSECGKFFADAEGKTEITKEQTILPKSEHKLTLVPEKKATCEEDGNKAYYICSHCDKLFEDAEGKKEISEEDTIIKAEGHKLTYHEAVEPTVEQEGNIEYWTCEVCGKFFADAEGKVEITEEQTILPKSEHKLALVPEKKAACEEDGNKAYYICSHCDKLFEDAEGKKEISEEDTIIKAEGHKLTYHEAVEPTVEQEGNIEYWTCEVCGKFFADVEGKTEITEEETKIEKLKDIADCTVSGLATKAYTGKAITPVLTVKYDGKTLKKGTDYTVAYANNTKAGTATVTIKGMGDYAGTITKKFLIKQISFKYRAYVQKKNWMSWSTAKVSGTEASKMAGTTQDLRMETIQMQLSGVSGSVEYRAYCAKKGWTQWATTADTKTYAGTKGESRRVELIQLRSKGQVATLYDMYFRAYSEKLGWLNWAKDGEKAGTQGYAYKLEAFQVNFVIKGETFKLASQNKMTKSFYDKTKDGANPK